MKSAAASAATIGTRSAYAEWARPPKRKARRWGAVSRADYRVPLMRPEYSLTSLRNDCIGTSKGRGPELMSDATVP